MNLMHIGGIRSSQITGGFVQSTLAWKNYQRIVKAGYREGEQCKRDEIKNLVPIVTGARFFMT